MLDAKQFGLSKRGVGRLGLAAALFGLLLSGCATTSDLPATEAEIVRTSSTFVMPPPGGPAILSVVSSTFPNAIRQDIFLATDARSTGENKISVIRFVGRGGDGSDSAIKDIPFTQVNLTEEALAAWPGSGMAVSPYFVQNSYGPFGYAIAKPPNGDTCLYAWQRIEPALKPSGAIARGTIIIRVQACQRGASEQALLEILYRLRLNFEVFPGRRAPAAIGAIAAPIRPVGAAGFVEVIPTSAPPVRAAAPAVRTPATPPPAPAIVTVPVPPPGAPIVPGPSGTMGASSPGIPGPGSSTSPVIVPSPTGG